MIRYLILQAVLLFAGGAYIVYRLRVHDRQIGYLAGNPAYEIKPHERALVNQLLTVDGIGRERKAQALGKLLTLNQSERIEALENRLTLLEAGLTPDNE